MKYFQFSLNSNTSFAFVFAFICIGLSAFLIVVRNKPFEKVGHFVIRDFMQVYVLGFVLPIWFVVFYQYKSLAVIGLTLFHWPYAILVNIVLAIALTSLFLNENKGKELHFRWGDVFYLMVAGIFETIFFYGFLRYYFELSFGIIPAILLASFFYSLHHIGFEVQMRGNTWFKELSKLFFVGIMYATVFRIFNSALAIYPMFWGVGAGFDILIEKEGRNFPWKNALVILVLMILTIIITNLL